MGWRGSRFSIFIHLKKGGGPDLGNKHCNKEHFSIFLSILILSTSNSFHKKLPFMIFCCIGHITSMATWNQTYCKDYF